MGTEWSFQTPCSLTPPPLHRPLPPLIRGQPSP